MGKTLNKLGKMSRREGVPLSTSASIIKVMQRRPYAPGAHGKANAGRPPRMSVFGMQLREKQKAKRLYGIMERQFRKYFEQAARRRGNTGESLCQLLETRLDNVVFRLGFAKTRPQARQMVGHGMFQVNGIKVNIPSYQVRVGDVIEIRAAKSGKKLIGLLEDHMKTATVPGWLHMEGGKGKVVSIPAGEDLKEAFDPKLIVEFYSMR